MINTIPVSEFCKLTHPSAAETEVASAIEWGEYTTSLVAVSEWRRTAPVNAWSDTCATDANDGQILFSRYECPNEAGGDLFTVGQLSSAYAHEELSELAVFSAAQRGAKEPHLIQQVPWSYMPTYRSDRVRSGLIHTMSQMQGENRTYHSGASFSHEAVSTISSFNAQLLSKVAS